MYTGLKGRALAIVAGLVVALSISTPAHAAEGSINLVKRAGPEFDRYTSSGSATDQAWIRSKFWRMMVYNPYFADKTGWYQHGWSYADLYAIYRDSDIARDHPDWILRDGAGRKLYIPWGCSGGTCPQYAADITNPAFRAWWIASAKSALAQGYQGLWVDDVNLEFRVGDGTGQQVAPRDPRTGTTMTWTAWRQAVADFTTQIRAEVPSDKQIVHNSIWYAGPGRDSDPSVKREIASADVINLERGVNDDGLTGGSGDWSLRAFLAFIDRVHALGKSVVFDAYDGSRGGREYSLANYLLISTGRDGLGESHAAPDDWWSGWDHDLGAAHGGRTTWNGLLRRDFDTGIALVNPPEAATTTVTLPRPMQTLDGNVVSSVTLTAKQGMVLLDPPPVGGDVPSTPPADDTPAPPSAPAPSEPAAPAPTAPEPTPPATEPTATPAPAPPAAGASVPQPASPVSPVSPAEPAAPVSAPQHPTVVRGRAKIARHGHRLHVRGRLAAAAGRTLRLELRRHRSHSWATVAQRTARADSRGRFAASFRGIPGVRYRAIVRTA